MSSEDLAVALQKLEEIKERQDKYEFIYLENKNKTNDAETVAVQGQHLAELSQMIASIKVSLDQIADQVFDNEKKIDDLEQYSRSNCLILHGCTDLPPKDSNNQATENFVLDKLNSKLKLDTPLVNSDIDICHTLPSKKNKNPIIIKFVRRTIRNKVFANKKNLKSADPAVKLSITESLTKRRLRLVDEARKFFKFRNVWTLNGTVYCFFKNKKHAIHDFCDINKIRFTDGH